MPPEDTLSDTLAARPLQLGDHRRSTSPAALPTRPRCSHATPAVTGSGTAVGDVVGHAPSPRGLQQNSRRRPARYHDESRAGVGPTSGEASAATPPNFGAPNHGHVTITGDTSIALTAVGDCAGRQPKMRVERAPDGCGVVERRVFPTATSTLGGLCVQDIVHSCLGTLFTPQNKG